MEKNKQNVRKGILIGCMVSAALLLGFLSSYAYFISTGNNNKNQSANVQTGNMALTFSDGNNGINESLNFGESITKTFTIENTGSLEAKAKINWLNLTNTYLKESLTYTLSYSESEDGEYTEIVTNKNVPVSETASTKTLANNLTIPVGTIYYYKLTITLNYLEDVDQTEDLNAILSTEFNLEEGIKESLETLKNLNLQSKKGNPDFRLPATTDETFDGLYAMEDNYGTSYYFRGASENNYVKFGDFYWRIIRINGDGSLRLIYDGTLSHTNGEESEDRVAILEQPYNLASNNYEAKYVGHMYGGEKNEPSTSKEQAQKNDTDSDIKIALDNWYNQNIKDKGLDLYVSDTLFCNDRSITSGEGYAQNNTYYESYNRIKTTKTPDLKCNQQNDAFTVLENEIGNASSTEKVGLITADEVSIAGGVDNMANNSYYLYKGRSYWTMSPSYINATSARVYYVFNTGLIDHYGTVGKKYDIVPVINIKAEYTSIMEGKGTINNPYSLT